MPKVVPDAVIPLVHNALRARYGEITILSGQGIAQGQRVEFTDRGKRVRAVIKTSSGGRISFARRGDGSWSGLSETERVIVVGPTERHGDDLVMSEFDKRPIKDAFEANYAAQKKQGMSDDVPSWIAPFHEEGRGARGVGDGFMKHASWTEPLKPVSVSTVGAAPMDRLTIPQAKEMLARTFGVSPDAIEIIIKG
jgi:hypothetical protein